MVALAPELRAATALAGAYHKALRRLLGPCFTPQVLPRQRAHTPRAEATALPPLRSIALPAPRLASPPVPPCFGPTRALLRYPSLPIWVPPAQAIEAYLPAIQSLCERTLAEWATATAAAGPADGADRAARLALLPRVAKGARLLTFEIICHVVTGLDFTPQQLVRPARLPQLRLPP